MLKNAGLLQKRNPKPKTHNQKQKTACKAVFLEVNPLGLEPRAHTLKVYCSTN